MLEQAGKSLAGGTTHTAMGQPPPTKIESLFVQLLAEAPSAIHCPSSSPESDFSIEELKLAISKLKAGTNKGNGHRLGNFRGTPRNSFD